MMSSTTDRSPPIVMSSQCTIATICLPSMQPCHTHGHAIHLVNLRSLSVDASSSSKFWAASRVPYKLCCTSPHMCSSPAWKSSGGSATNTLLSVGARKYALRTSTSATNFPPRLPVAITDSTTLSASSGGVDVYNSGLACVLYSFVTHLKRPLGFPGCPL